MNYENLLNLVNEIKGLIEENERLTKELLEAREQQPKADITVKSIAKLEEDDIDEYFEIYNHFEELVLDDIGESALEFIAERYATKLANNDDIRSEVLTELKTSDLDEIVSSYYTELADYSGIKEAVIENLEYEIGDYRLTTELGIMKALIEYHDSEAQELMRNDESFMDDIKEEVKDDIREELEEEIKDDLKQEIKDAIDNL